MRSLFRPRIALAVLLPAALIGVGVSATATMPFVSSGAYATARAAAANCQVAFFPAFDDADWGPMINGRAVTEAGFGGALASLVGLHRAGRYESYHYKMLPVDAAHVKSYTGSTYDALSLPAGSRMDVYEAPGFAMSSIATPTPAGCARLILRSSPVEIQVGIRGGPLLDLVAGTIMPGKADLLVATYVDGVPVGGKKVKLWTTSWASPGRYGATMGHDHIALTHIADNDRMPEQARYRFNPTHYPPTTWLDGQTPNRGAVPLTVTTDDDPQHRGMVTVGIHAGFRGGPEGIYGVFDNNGSSVAGAGKIIPRHKRFVDWVNQIGGGDQTPRADFPYLMTGATAEHLHNHYMQPQNAVRFNNGFRAALQADRGLAAAWAHSKPYWLQLNDMALEYGGDFRLLHSGSSGTDTFCDALHKTANDPSIAHHTHQEGIDTDFGSCYSIGTTRITGPTKAGDPCPAGSLHVNYAVYAKTFQALGGRVYNEGNHYHGRFMDKGEEGAWLYSSH